MEYRTILYEEREGIAFITVNRTEKLNALNAEVIAELDEAFRHVRESDSVGAVVITGAGEKAFVAGADIGELAKQDAASGRMLATRGQALFNLIENLGKPVIAAVNGFALGGGCELAMAATLRTASENAKFGQPEVNLGIIPGYGGTQRLPRLVGKGRAMEIILTGDMIDAQEAYRTGLVNKVFPQKDLLAETEKIARKVMLRGPVAVRYAMESVNRGLEMGLADGLAYEASLLGLLCATDDMREGLKAFLEKRKPEFKGK